SDVSPAARRLGMRGDIVRQVDLLRGVHPRDRAQLDRVLEEVQSRQGGAARSEPVTARFRYRVAGTWRWLEVMATDLRDDVDVRGIVLNARDITEREESAHKLRVSEAYYRAIFEKSLEGVILVNADRTIRSVSGAVVRMLGHAV